MGFDLYGENAKDKAGEYFRNNCWWWRGLQYLILEVAKDILTAKEREDLGWNNGGLIPQEKAVAIAERLEKFLKDKKDVAQTKKDIMEALGESYSGCWSVANIKEFIKFARSSGGFTIS